MRPICRAHAPLRSPLRQGVLALSLALLATPSPASPNPESEAIAERLAGAIRFETISYEDPADFRPEPFEALEAYLRATYPRTFARLTLEKPGGHTLFLEWTGSDPGLAPALFMSHTDVVPVSEAAAAEWTRPPYSGVIEDGYVWGRGALDVKTGVILWLEAVEALLEQGVAPKRTVFLSFGHDEEVGGEEGAGRVAARLAERGIRLAFVFDEGGMILDGHPLLPHETVAYVVTAEKAYLNVDLVARGVSGHSSMPPPSTAIGRLARAIAAVEANPMPARFTLPVREMLETAAPHLPFPQRLVMNNLWLFGGAVKRRLLADDVSAATVRTTFATTLVEGGVKANVLPERAQATVNVRILPGDTVEGVVEHIRAAIDDPGIEIVPRGWNDAPAPASIEGPAFRLAAESVHAYLPEAVVLPGLVPGATDTRHFVGIADELLRFVPMRVGIDQVGGAHGRDERIAVEPLARSRAIAIEMVRRAAAGD